MNTCKTCRWWGRDQLEPYSDYVVDDNDKGQNQLSEAKRCSCPKTDINEDGYCAVKGDGFGLDYPVCDLVTGPDFGCVHHEEKE